MTTVEDILMSKGPDVIVSSADTTVFEAAKMMSEANVGAVIICDEGKVLGIFTERDLLRRVVATGQNTETTPLSEVMTSPVTCVCLDTPIKVCMDMMMAGQFRNLAVTEDGVLIGQVSLPSVLTAKIVEQDNQA